MKNIVLSLVLLLSVFGCREGDGDCSFCPDFTPFEPSEADLNQLSFGLSAGLTQSRLDETQFDLTDFDPVIGGIIQSTSYFNVDAGLSYNFLDFSAHFTVKNIIFQNRSI